MLFCYSFTDSHDAEKDYQMTATIIKETFPMSESYMKIKSIYFNQADCPMQKYQWEKVNLLGKIVSYALKDDFLIFYIHYIQFAQKL